MVCINISIIFKSKLSTENSDISLKIQINPICNITNKINVDKRYSNF